MPIISEDQTLGGLTPQQQPDIADDADYLDLLGVSYDTITSQGQIAQAAGYLSATNNEIDPDFEVTDEDLAGYEDAAFNLLQSRNAQELETKKMQFDKERSQDEQLANAGFMGGLAALHAGATDLTNFIPIIGLEKAGYNVSRIGKIAGAAKTGAAYGFAVSAGQEAIAQSTRISRTAEESYLNIGASTILGGALGGSLGYVANRVKIDKAADDMAKIGEAYADELAVRYGDSVGAAAVKKTTLEQETLVGALGLEKAISKTSPTLSLLNSPSVEVRRVSEQLADSGLSVKKYEEGIASAVPVESMIRQHDARLTLTTPKTFDDYIMYRSGRKPLPGEAAATGMKDLLRKTPDGKYTFTQFREEIGKAMARNDEHEVPEVAAAAKRYRKEIFDPLKNEAVALGLLPEDIDPKTAASYITRLYNHEKIISGRQDFEGRISTWLKRGNESANERFDNLTKKASGIEAKIAKNAEEIESLKAAKGDKERIRQLREENKKLNERLKKTQESAETVRILSGMSDSDLGDIAAQITDGLIAMPEGRVHYDGIPLVRGPLKERTLMITDAEIEDFLDRDIFRIASFYNRSMGADVELTRAFGRADMQDQIQEINQAYNDLRNTAAKKLKGEALAKENKKLDARQRGDIERIEGIRDRLRSTYGLPANPLGLVSRTARTLKVVNYLRLLGGMTISAFADVARPVMTHGVMRTFNDGVVPMVRNLKQAKLAMNEAKLAGTALDMINNERALAIAGLDNQWLQITKFERGLDAMADNFKYVSLMAPWNAGMKNFVALISQTRSLEAIEQLATGAKISKKELTRLAKFGVDEEMASRIYKQVKKHGEKKDGMWWANTDKWDDLNAVRTYRAGMQREIDNTIITPGQELPLFMSTQMGGLLMQFKSFGMASTQRMLIAGLQQRDMATLNGFMMSVALGMLVYRLKAQPQDLSSDPEKWIAEGIDRSGALGWFMEGNNMLEKVTGGAFGINAVLGTKPASRYASRGAAAAAFGPSFGTVFDTIVPIVAASANGEMTGTDIHKMRQMLPYQNLFYIRGLFDQLEEGTTSALGLEQRKKR